MILLENIGQRIKKHVNIFYQLWSASYPLKKVKQSSCERIKKNL